jgi:hypothetical protein
VLYSDPGKIKIRKKTERTKIRKNGTNRKNLNKCSVRVRKKYFLKKQNRKNNEQVFCIRIWKK